MTNGTETPNVQAVFRALADPSRRRIISMLSQSDMTIAEVADRFETTRAAVRKHLTILEEGRVVVSEVRGRERVHRFEPRALKVAADWLGHFEQFWDDRLMALKQAVEAETNNQEEK